jgi:hypothetical protein
MTAQGVPARPPGGALPGNDVLVTLLDGGELRGGVDNFNPQLGGFYLLQAGGESLRVSFDKVRMVSFLRAEGARAEVSFPATARLVTVRFLDQELLHGVTQNFGGPRRGLFLVPTALAGVERVYVPVTAIREVVSVQRLGEILTEQRMATPAMVEQAIERQRHLREEPLGQILLRRQKIKDEHLAEGLKLQRERQGSRIGEILVEQRFISREELDEALEAQKRQRDKKLGEIMIDMGFASHKMIGIALSIQYNVPFVSLASQTLEPRLRELVPSDRALRWQLLPLSLADGVLTVAVADPSDNAYKDALRGLTGLAVTEVVATPQDLTRALASFYG